jgi:hypothetical protein
MTAASSTYVDVAKPKVRSNPCAGDMEVSEAYTRGARMEARPRTRGPSTLLHKYTFSGHVTSRRVIYKRTNTPCNIKCVFVVLYHMLAKSAFQIYNLWVLKSGLGFKA